MGQNAFCHMLSTCGKMQFGHFGGLVTAKMHYATCYQHVAKCSLVILEPAETSIMRISRGLGRNQSEHHEHQPGLRPRQMGAVTGAPKQPSFPKNSAVLQIGYFAACWRLLGGGPSIMSISHGFVGTGRPVCWAEGSVGLQVGSAKPGLNTV